MRVTDIKVRVESFAALDDPESFLSKMCEKIKRERLHADPRSLLPRQPRHLVDFTMHTYAEFANVIRTCMIEETPVKALEYDPYDRKNVITDEFILSDVLQRSINAIRIDQKVDYKDLTISLNVTNDTDVTRVVLSREITVTRGKGSKIECPWSGTFIVAELHPRTSIRISLRVVMGIGVENNNKYLAISNIRYLPRPPSDRPQSASDADGKTPWIAPPDRSSAFAECSVFDIGFSTHRNILPVDFINIVHDTLHIRLDVIREELKRVVTGDDGMITHTSDKLEISTIAKYKYVILMLGERRPIPAMISRQCFMLTAEDPGIISVDVYQSTRQGRITIHRKGVVALMLEAIERCIADLRKFRDDLIVGLRE